MIESQEEHNPNLPKYQEIVQLAEEKFWSSRLYVGPGGLIEPYGLYSSVEDTFAEMEIHGLQILPELIRNTSSVPEDTQSGDLIQEAKDWQEAFDIIAKEIIIEDLSRRPGIQEELDQRFKDENNLNFPEI